MTGDISSVVFGPIREDRPWEKITHDKHSELADLLADNKAEKLATAHWQYIESVLRQHGEDEDVIAKCGHHYVASFVHGWKHAKEDA